MLRLLRIRVSTQNAIHSRLVARSLALREVDDIGVEAHGHADLNRRTREISSLLHPIPKIGLGSIAVVDVLVPSEPSRCFKLLPIFRFGVGMPLFRFHCLLPV